MKKLFKDIGLVGLADFARTLKALILIPVLTKSLGAEGYGIFTQLRITVIFFVPILMLGLDEALIRFVSGQENKNVIRSNFISCSVIVMAISSVCALLAFLCAPLLSHVILGSKQLYSLVRISAFLLVLYPMDSITLAYFRTLRQMKNYFLFLNAELITEVLLIVLTIFLGMGIKGVLFALIACKLVFLMAKGINITFQMGLAAPDWSNLRNLIPFGVPIISAGIFYFLLNYGDRYIIRYLLGLDQVGIYSVGYALGMLIIVLMTPFDYVLYPKIASYWNNNKVNMVGLYIKRTLAVSVSLASAACIVMIIFAPKIVIAISNETFKQAASVVPYISLGFLVYGIGIMGERIIMLLNKTVFILILYAFLALLNVVLNFYFVSRIGIQGAALATFITFVVYAIIMLTRSYKYIF